MEREPKHRNQENSDEAAKDDSESSKKKKKRAKDLAELLSKKAESDEAKPEPQSKEAEPSTWQKLLGEAQSSSDRKEQSESDDEAAEKDEENDDDQAASEQEIINQLEAGDETPEIENLSQEEQAAVAKAYIEARLVELENSEDEPDSETEHSTLEDFLQNLRARISRPSHESEDIGRAIEDSFAESVGPAPEAFAGQQEETVEANPRAETSAGPEPDTAAPESMPDERSEFLPDRPVPIYSRPDTRHDFEAPLQTKEEYISHNESMTREAQAQARGVAAGLLFGYLIGRRRGRIKTEKRLQKVQTKLEKQVNDVKNQIAGKELQIKKLTQSSRETGARLQAAEASNKLARARQPERVAEASNQNAPSFADREERPTGRQPAMELSSASRAAFIPASERVPSARSPEAKPTYHHNSASRQEIIEKSGQIKIGESDLRKVWEARLIDEHGLRRIVAEAEAGGDVRRALASEFLARELRFERDPYLKDRSQNQEKKSAGQAGTAYVAQSLSQQAGSLDADAAHSAGGPVTASQSNHVSPQPVKVSPWLLTGLTVLTVGLAIWAIYLMITA